MGILTRVLEKSGYELDLKTFEAPPAEVVFEVVEEDTMTGVKAPKGEQQDERLQKVVKLSSELAESFRLLRSKLFTSGKW
jgi:hypothetical protein